MEKSRIGKEWGKEFMAQHAILRFEKHKGNPARPLEAHHERQKEQYASNPDIDTSRSKWCCTIKVDIENSKGQYIEKDKQEATKDGSESTKIQHGI